MTPTHKSGKSILIWIELKVIRAVCDSTLDIIAEFDKGWSEKVRERASELINSQFFYIILLLRNIDYL